MLKLIGLDNPHGPQAHWVGQTAAYAALAPIDCIKCVHCASSPTHEKNLHLCSMKVVALDFLEKPLHRLARYCEVVVGLKPHPKRLAHSEESR